MKNKFFTIFISFLVIFTALIAIGPVSHATGLYKVTFIENGLPAGTNWSVSINNTVHYSLNSSISVLLPNGVYKFTVSNVMGYNVYPYSANIIVNGSNVIQNIQYIYSSQSKIIGTIPTMAGYQITVYDSANGYIYDGIYQGSLIYVINPNENKVINTINLNGPLTNYVIVNNFIYALSSSANAIYVISPSTGQTVNTVTIPSGAINGFGYSSYDNSLYFYVQNSGLYQLSLNILTPSLVANTSVVSISPLGGGTYNESMWVIGPIIYYISEFGASPVTITFNYYSITSKTTYNLYTYGVYGGVFYRSSITDNNVYILSLQDDSPIPDFAGYNYKINTLTNTVTNLGLIWYGASVAYDPINHLLYYDSGNVSDPNINSLISTIKGLSPGYGKVIYDNGYIYDPQNGNIAIINTLTSSIYQVNFQALKLTNSPGAVPFNNQTWAITFNGQTQYSSSSLIVFTVPTSGTYYYSISQIKGYIINPLNGFINIAGDMPSTTIYVNFTQIPSDNYLVSFIEYGLPNGTSWSVTFNNQLINSTGNMIEFYAPNGSYNFSAIVYNSMYSGLVGKIIVNGNTIKDLYFSASSGSGWTWIGPGISNWYNSLTSIEIAMLWATIFSFIIGLITFLFYVKSEKHNERMLKSNKRKKIKKRR